MKIFFFALLLFFTPHLLLAKLSNETEAGIAATNGNSKNQSYNFKQLNNLDAGKNRYVLHARYLNASSQGEETARYLMMGLRYERAATNSFSFFMAETLERDHFAGIDKRYISDAGGKYHFIKEEKLRLFSELGYRYTIEKQNSGDELFSSSIRLYLEWEQQWSEVISTKYWVEYLPNLSETKDYLLNTEFSVSAMLSNIFSLKSSYLIRYDNRPVAEVAHKTDGLLTTALVAKF